MVVEGVDERSGFVVVQHQAVAAERQQAGRGQAAG
jgi:hypothetical protein